ncbi:MAG: phosphate acyltransferase PlsX [Anaerovoracaceae bacterium]|jgi:glycerol-3-phosphate acyltransferase PlsX
MKIAIDGMGGDNAPQEIVKGCVEAARMIDDEIYIVGVEDAIRKELKNYISIPGNIKIVNATQVITGEDQPVKAVRAKKDSSLIKAISLVREGICDAVISAGNTGALMAGSLFILGRIKGIERPAIGTSYPQADGSPTFLVDAGANAECKPSQLVQFATMGSIYMEKVIGVENPSVGLINIGTEEHKGTPVLKETYQLLKESNINFCGNIEARDIPYHPADVFVCDGFTGNNILKLTEGMAQRYMALLKDMFKSNVVTKMSAVAMMGKLKELKELMDYSEYGAAPLLGIKGVVLKMHGSSKSNAVKNAIIKGRKYVEENVVGIIDQNVAKYGLENAAKQDDKADAANKGA